MLTFKPSSSTCRFSSRVPKSVSMFGAISMLFFIQVRRYPRVQKRKAQAQSLDVRGKTQELLVRGNHARIVLRHMRWADNCSRKSVSPAEQPVNWWKSPRKRGAISSLFGRKRLFFGGRRLFKNTGLCRVARSPRAYLSAPRGPFFVGAACWKSQASAVPSEPFKSAWTSAPQGRNGLAQRVSAGLTRQGMRVPEGRHNRENQATSSHHFLKITNTAATIIPNPTR